MTITAIASLYLLGVLGVEGEGNIMVFISGGAGATSLMLTFIISATISIRTRNEHQQSGNLEMQPNIRSIRGISSTELEEGIFVGALV